MSRFLQNNRHQAETVKNEIDFEEAIPLPAGGSTGDIYRARWQRRDVFVKRLKEKYRSNPLYLDALDKEYEIGITLKHPSLPYYHFVNHDYIVMDYIDGVTLEDKIKSKDPWLTKERNIINLLKNLVEVTEYLHKHHVTHCDIKPDNIMLSLNNHNVILIDFDKCYSDYLHDTSGDPSKYGLTKQEKGRIQIDFHGIAGVVEKIKDGVPGFQFCKYNEFITECLKPEPSADELLNILDYNPGKVSKKFYWMVTLAPFCVALLFGLVLLLIQGRNGYDENYGISDPASQVNDSLHTNSVGIKNQGGESEKDVKFEEKQTVKELEEIKTLPTPISQEDLHTKAQNMAVLLDKRIQPLFEELNISLDNLEKLKLNPDLNPEQLLDSIRSHSNKEDEFCEEAFAILKETFPDLTDREAWRVMAYSKAYTGYKRRATPLLENYFN